MCIGIEVVFNAFIFIFKQLDDAALQLYKDGDYCSYLDLDSSISEQQEDFEGFQPRYAYAYVIFFRFKYR